MKIKTITLKGFGKFDEGFTLSLDSPSNVNVIVGKNESGKSTIANSIFGILFGFSSTDQDRFQPWKSSSFWGALQIANGINEYRIERDFQRHAVKVKRIDMLNNEESIIFDGIVSPHGKLSTEKEKYLSLLNEFLGFSDSSIFRSTVYLSQNEIATLGDDEMAGKIKTYISGSLETNYEKVLERLKESYFELTKSNPWGRDLMKNRRLEESELRIQELKDQMVDVQQALQTRRSIEKDRDGLTATLQEASDQFEQCQTIVTKVTEYRELEKDVTELKESFEQHDTDLNTVISMNLKSTQLDDEYNEVAFMEALPEDFPERANELNALLNKVKASEKRVATEKTKLDTHPKRHITLTVTIALIVFILIVCGSFILWEQLDNAIIPVITSALAFVCASAVIVGTIWRKANSNEIRQQITGRMEVMQEELTEHQMAADELKTLLADAFPDGSLIHIERLKKKFTLFKTLVQQKREAGMILSKFSDEETVRTRFEKVQAELNTKSELLTRAKNNASYVDTLSPEEEENYRRKSERLDVEIREMTARLKTVEQDYWSMGASDANLNVMEDELEELEAVHSSLRHRTDATYLALTTLMNAQTRYHESYMERFCELISTRFREITNGAYQSVELSEDTMEAMVSNADNDRIPVSMLSTGAQDQLYLCMRLAIIRYLTADRSLPIIIDDSFVTFDSGRLDQTKFILEDIAKNNQVILFTHDRRYLNWQAPVYDFDHAQHVV